MESTIIAVPREFRGAWFHDDNYVLTRNFRTTSIPMRTIRSVYNISQ